MFKKTLAVLLVVHQSTKLIQSSVSSNTTFSTIDKTSRD